MNKTYHVCPSWWLLDSLVDTRLVWEHLTVKVTVLENWAEVPRWWCYDPIWKS